MSAVDRRATELDTIATVLPLERRDEMAELLTDQDVATLRHLVNEGMGQNTLRALASDFAYLQAWALAATAAALPWPAPVALLLKFVAHHSWDLEKRTSDPEHGMPESIAATLRSQGLLRSPGPHAPDTVERPLATWSTLTKWRGLDGQFSAPSLKSAIRLAVRAIPRQRKRKSAKAVTGDVLAKLLATCSSGSLRDIRDRAILMVAFASGGRRRSEIAGLRSEQLTAEAPIPVEDGTPLPSLAIHLGRTKTSSTDQDEVVYLTGRPVEALNAWLSVGRISSGSIFRKIDRWGNVSPRALEPAAINAIVKMRAEMAGLEPADYSAHGLRSGYLTEAANRGIPLPEAMEQGIAPSSRRRATTTMPPAALERRRASSEASCLWLISRLHFTRSQLRELRFMMSSSYAFIACKPPQEKSMDGIYLSSVLIFLILVGVSLSAVICYPRLPARHREDETNATIRLIANVFVVMTSLVFGLMVNSARSSYQGLDENIHSFATQLILFDRTLRELNPSSDEGRDRLVAYVQYVISQPLPTEDPLIRGDRASEGLLNAVGDVLKSVDPQGERQLSLLQDARHQFEQLTQQRWAIVEHSTDSIPVPMVIMLVAWLTVIFASFGYRAPYNATVVSSLVIAAFLISTSLAMVMDMNVPFSGLIQVSDQPLRSVLAEIKH